MILPDLDRHQCGQVVLVLGEQLAEPGHQRAAHRGRGARHAENACGGIGDRLIGLLGCGLRDGEQHLAGDRCAGRQPVLARLAERDVGADGVQGLSARARNSSTVVTRVPPCRAIRKVRKGRECDGR